GSGSVTFEVPALAFGTSYIGTISISGNEWGIAGNETASAFISFTTTTSGSSSSSGSGSSSSSSSGSGSSSSSAGAEYITVTPSVITRSPNTGVPLVIQGYNFKENSTGYISASSIQIGSFKASSTGYWSTTVYNTMNAASVSGLWNAIQNAGSKLSIQAYDYGDNTTSNTVEVTLI
ncbi:MAG: hypothetical protein ACP5MB_10305, partial [bacterium]